MDSLKNKRAYKLSFVFYVNADKYRLNSKEFYVLHFYTIVL